MKRLLLPLLALAAWPAEVRGFGLLRAKAATQAYPLRTRLRATLAKPGPA